MAFDIYAVTGESPRLSKSTGQKMTPLASIGRLFCSWKKPFNKGKAKCSFGLQAVLGQENPDKARKFVRMFKRRS